ncbi:MAG: CarD family transcriptional regulator [Alphaproteobacteria bacterium]|nr:CarD family transcriptional regulator [Alphaproteobacteria bacterium]
MATKKKTPAKTTKPQKNKKKAPVKKIAARRNPVPAIKIEAKKPEAKKIEVKKPEKRDRGSFAAADYVVYPTHGVGQITGLEEAEVAGQKLKFFVIAFEKDKMTLRVPVGKAQTSGMRKLATKDEMNIALTTLKGRARIKRTMWSRRAQEYEAKINSGSPISIAEVIRDLHRSAGKPDQSYSERQLYEAALDRLARELAAVERIDQVQATTKLEQMLRAA